MLPRIIKIAGTFLRGVIKAFPLGNAIIEGVNNVKGGVPAQVVTEGGDVVNGTVTQPHDWFSIITQVAVIGLIFYALYSGKIDLTQAIVWIKGS